MSEFDETDSGCSSRISNIRDELYGSSGSNVRDILRYQASLISDYALGKEPYPDKIFSIILEFMSTAELFSKKGAPEFFFYTNE